MFRNLASYKRQIEILTMFYPNHLFKNCSIDDLADKYNVSIPTINRDLQDLRSMGVPIYSQYGKGVKIEGKVDLNAVSSLIIKYIALYYSDVSLQNALFKAVERNNLSYIYIFRTLSEAVDKHQKVFVEYNKNRFSKIAEKFLPYKIMFNNNELEFIGIYNNNPEIIKFSKIISIKSIDEFDNTEYAKIAENFISRRTEKSSVNIEMQLEIKGYMNISKYEISRFEIISVNKNKVKPERSINSLDDLAEWAIMHHDNVKVLEPKKQRDEVLEIAEKTIENYHIQLKLEQDSPLFKSEDSIQFCRKEIDTVNEEEVTYNTYNDLDNDQENKSIQTKYDKSESTKLKNKEMEKSEEIWDKLNNSGVKYMRADRYLTRHIKFDLNFESLSFKDKSKSFFKKLYNRISH